ncbi:MAG TPA: tetratricopeptide repeat protein [Chthoniobacteraceae bacterium]|nr:tetratricopeptide repeat protein [Chthoniobacteraceae bacterium]
MPDADRSPAFPANWWATPQAHGLTALIAFAAGVFAAWLLMGGLTPRQAETGPHASAPSSAPAHAVAGGGGATSPSVSHTPQATPSGLTAERALAAGNAYYDQRRWMDAITQYEYAIANGIDNPNVRTDLANCLRFIGLPERALEQYRHAQEEDIGHEQSLFNMATLYTEVLRDIPKAIEIWRLYLQRFPQSVHTPRVRQFLTQNPQFSAALEETGVEAAPAEALPPAGPTLQSAPAHPPLPSSQPELSEKKKNEMMEWMKQGEPAATATP